MIIIQPSASRTTNPRAPIPSSKLLGTIIRPLWGLITLLFGQSVGMRLCQSVLCSKACANRNNLPSPKRGPGDLQTDWQSGAGETTWK